MVNYTRQKSSNDATSTSNALLTCEDVMGVFRTINSYHDSAIGRMLRLSIRIMRHEYMMHGIKSGVYRSLTFVLHSS